MIISIVISSLLQLFSNNSHNFTAIQEKIGQANKTSLLLGNKVYGLENKKVDLAELVKDFNIDDNLRRKLKKEKVSIIYTEETSIDFDDAAESISDAESKQNDEEQVITDAAAATNTLEIGKTTLKIGNQSSSFLRVKFQWDATLLPS